LIRPAPSRTRAALAAAAAILVAGGVVAAVPAAAAPKDSGTYVLTAMPSLDAQIAAGINAARVRYGLARLRLSRPLRAAAAYHSFDLANSGTFSHDSTDGNTAGQRLARYYPSAGYRRWQVGETLYWASPGTTAAEAVGDWLASPEHRAILLTPAFREIGVSAVHSAAADGSGDDSTVVTADFGVRTR
jgi:uncharacterized protein YkwD